MQGLKACYQSEAAFRQELWLSIVFISLAFWLKESAIERVLLIAPVFLVLIVEEALIMRFNPVASFFIVILFYIIVRPLYNYG
jgi:hypothetical protein